MTDLGEAMALWLYQHGIKEDLSGNSIRAVWLDAALSAGTRDLRSGRPAAGDSGSIRHGVSKTPTLPAPRTSNAETLLTPRRAESNRRRMLYVVVPVLALLVGAVGAFAAVGLRTPEAAPVPAVAAAPAPAAQPEPAAPAAVAPAAAPVAEPPPASSASTPKAAVSTVAKGKVRAPAVRKKGHDFGF